MGRSVPGVKRYDGCEYGGGGGCVASGGGAYECEVSVGLDGERNPGVRGEGTTGCPADDGSRRRRRGGLPSAVRRRERRAAARAAAADAEAENDGGDAGGKDRGEGGEGCVTAPAIDGEVEGVAVTRERGVDDVAP